MARTVASMASDPGANGVTMDVFMQHNREVTIALVKKKEADSILQHAYKRAKAAGVNLDSFKAAQKAKKIGAEQVLVDQRDFAQYCAWLDMPIGTQGSLGVVVQPLTEKAKRETRVLEAEQAGYTAGTNGQTVSDCPHKPGEDVHAAWVRGLHRGISFMEGRGGDEVVPPRQEPIPPRARGSRGKAAKPAKQDNEKVVHLPMNGGGRRKTRIPAQVPEASPPRADDEGEDTSSQPHLH